MKYNKIEQNRIGQNIIQQHRREENRIQQNMSFIEEDTKKQRTSGIVQIHATVKMKKKKKNENIKYPPQQSQNKRLQNVLN